MSEEPKETVGQVIADLRTTGNGFFATRLEAALKRRDAVLLEVAAEWQEIAAVSEQLGDGEHTFNAYSMKHYAARIRAAIGGAK